ncbi:MAG: divergent polysaccharide deacetylase family protein, partial [Candidatus Neomarinimicrobiota bacterium]
ERFPVGKFTFAPKTETTFAESGVRGQIALIIDDFGYMHNRATEGFMNLRESLTFSVIPGHRFSQILAEEADRSGHEVIVHMPMEPENYNGRDEAEYILRFGMEEEEVLSRTRRAFLDLPEAVGMNNHEGSLATLDTVMLQTVARVLLERGKYFVDSYTTPNTKAEEVMRTNGVPTLGRQVFLDNVDDPAYIRRQLSRLATMAERNGNAIGIGHVGSSHLNTLEVLQEEIPLLKGRGFEFVLVSELISKTIN